MTVSKASLDQTFVHAVHCATDAGLNTEGWTLEHGSRANGVSYVLSNGLGRMRERLGATRAEAYATLQAMARAWQMITEGHTRRAEEREREDRLAQLSDRFPMGS